MHILRPVAQVATLAEMNCQDRTDTIAAISDVDRASVLTAMSAEEKEAALHEMVPEERRWALHDLSSIDRALALAKMSSADKESNLAVMSTNRRAETEDAIQRMEAVNCMVPEERAHALAEMTVLNCARTLHGLKPMQRVATMRTMPMESKLNCLSAMSDPDRAATIVAMTPGEKADLFEEMSLDQRQALLRDLSGMDMALVLDQVRPAVRQEALNQMSQQDQEQTEAAEALRAQYSSYGPELTVSKLASLGPKERKVVVHGMRPIERCAFLFEEEAGVRAEEIARLSPSDLEETLCSMRQDEKADALRAMDDDARKEALFNLHPVDRALALSRMSPEERVHALSVMGDGEREQTVEAEKKAGDLVHMTAEERAKALGNMNLDERMLAIHSLEPEHRIMTLAYVLPKARAATLMAMTDSDRMYTLTAMTPEEKAEAIGILEPSHQIEALHDLHPIDRWMALEGCVDEADAKSWLNSMNDKDRQEYDEVAELMDDLLGMAHEERAECLNNKSELRRIEAMHGLHPAERVNTLNMFSAEEAAAYLLACTDGDRVTTVVAMQPEQQAQMLWNLPDKVRTETIHDMSPDERRTALVAMSADERAAALAGMSEADRSHTVSGTPPAEAVWRNVSMKQNQVGDFSLSDLEFGRAVANGEIQATDTTWIDSSGRKQLNPKYNALARQLFNLCDSDNSGQLDLQEFIMICMVYEPTLSADGLEIAFAEACGVNVGVDHDMDVSEFNQWLASTFYGLGEQDFLGGIRDFKVKTEQVRNMYRASGQAEETEQLKKLAYSLFTCLDADNNGGLSRSELVAFHGADQLGFVSMIDKNKDQFADKQLAILKADLKTLEAQSQSDGKEWVKLDKRGSIKKPLMTPQQRAEMIKKKRAELEEALAKALAL